MEGKSSPRECFGNWLSERLKPERRREREWVQHDLIEACDTQDNRGTAALSIGLQRCSQSAVSEDD